MSIKRIAVVGGGAAGMFAAGRAAENGVGVTLFEKNNILGKKLRITGKGRCNVTNNCTPDEFLKNVPTNPRFLYSSICSFTPQDTMSFFENHGVKLKTERGQRVFPVSDNAADIAGCLKTYCSRNGVKIVNEKVLSIFAEDDRFSGLSTRSGKHSFDAGIICTGGISYPLTGSDGDGLHFARELGILTIPCSPSLVPVVSNDGCCPEMQGLTLKNVGLTIKDNNGKIRYRDFGELLFTHFGLSGPMILSASAHIKDIQPGKYTAHIDLKPALDEKALDERILSDFSKYSNKDYINSLSDLLPQKIINVFIEKSGIEPRKKVNIINKEERAAIRTLLKDFPVSLDSFRPVEEAIITSGGVSVKEIDPKTMESKKIKNLYFAGELIDVDAYTGGFNLQIAFSTAWAAAAAAGEGTI